MKRFPAILVISIVVFALALVGGMSTIIWLISGNDIKITNSTPYPMTEVRIEIDWNHKINVTTVKDIPAGTTELVELPRPSDESLLYLSYILNGRALRADCDYYDGVGIDFKLEVSSETEPAKCEYRRD